MIKFWTCPDCGRANALGKPRCRCGAERVDYTVNDAGEIAPKPTPSAQEQRERDEANRQARLKRKIEIPHEAEGFITSTFKRQNAENEQ